MPKINLLYIIAKLELGGAQKHLLSLACLLDKSKYNIYIFTAQKGLLLQEAQSLNYIKLIKSEFLERPVNFIKDFLAAKEIYSFIKKNNIHIVHTHGSKAGILGRFAARLAQVKVLLHTVHGWSFNRYQNFIVRWLFIRLERFCAKFSDRIIVVSEYDKKKGIIEKIGIDAKYRIIPYGINQPEFSRKVVNLRNGLGIDDTDLIVGMVACFKPQKSPLDFIKVAASVNKAVPNSRFILIGDGVLRKKIEAQIIKSGLSKSVILSGWRRDIPEMLAAVDVFVLTSLWEGVPISVLEAMAAAKPVVATNTGGIAEVIIEGVNGYLVCPKDIVGMSKRVITLLSNQNLREQLGQNAHKSLDERFSREKMSQETATLYEEILNAKAG